ncbi:hypothetical protein KFE25_011377 [Diacronema lutheri]|uniref:RING-type E3 ubiquitin transferase n=2 Tax=Diacronema lutheri TaxID=2081491 RepID=A0A8J5XBQ3_DIALT|nr:hypothetical protein KFE25_011377 [Diacronema lutheri]
MSSGGARWEWDGGASVGWVPYDEEAAQQLELAHAAGRKSTRLLIRDVGYTINLGQMAQQNESTRFCRAVRRTPVEEDTADGDDAAACVDAPQPPSRARARRSAPAARAPPPAAMAAKSAVPARLRAAAPGAHGGAARRRSPPRAAAPADELEGTVRFASHDGQLELAHVTDWRLLLPSEYDPEAECAITCCPFGHDRADPVVKLSCGCMFNQSTVERALLAKPQCPICRFQFEELLGPMPSGTMTVWREDEPCEGNDGARSFVLHYAFPSGRQGPQHPQPGIPYDGTERLCFVPDTTDGRRTVRLLREAFRRGLTFKIGTSITTGRANQVTWAIHHKTSRYGGTPAHGYPDPSYHARCAAECAALGLLIDEGSAAAGEAERTAEQAEGDSARTGGDDQAEAAAQSGANAPVSACDEPPAKMPRRATRSAKGKMPVAPTAAKRDRSSGTGRTARRSQ